MATKDQIFYRPSCGVNPCVDSTDNLCKTKIKHFIGKEPKHKKVFLDLLYVFPFDEKQKCVALSYAKNIFKSLYDCDESPEMGKCVLSVDIKEFSLNVEVDNDHGEFIWAIPTTDLVYAIELETHFKHYVNLIAIQTRPTKFRHGYVLIFDIPHDKNASKICETINYMIENAQDNLIIEAHSDDEFTIDYSMLKSHVNILNNIIKEVIDLAIVVARTVDARKKLEKGKKSNKGKKFKNASLKIIAYSPTSEEFVDIFQKVRLGLNIMARLNPFVNHPNIPELLHHLVSPFSLLTAVCGLDIVTSIKKPYLSTKAIWLIENCLTTNELAFWRTLGDAWNKPRCRLRLSDPWDCDYEPVFRGCKSSEPQDLGSASDCSIEAGDPRYEPDLNLAVVICNHDTGINDELSAFAGSFVNIMRNDGEYYYVLDVEGYEGYLPRSKVCLIKREFGHDSLLVYLRFFMRNLYQDWFYDYRYTYGSQNQQENDQSLSDWEKSVRIHENESHHEFKDTECHEVITPEKSKISSEVDKSTDGSFAHQTHQPEQSPCSDKSKKSYIKWISKSSSKVGKICEPIKESESVDHAQNPVGASDTSFKSSQSHIIVKSTVSDEKSKYSKKSDSKKKKTKGLFWCCRKKPDVDLDHVFVCEEVDQEFVDSQHQPQTVINACTEESKKTSEVTMVSNKSEISVVSKSTVSVSTINLQQSVIESSPPQSSEPCAVQESEHHSFYKEEKVFTECTEKKREDPKGGISLSWEKSEHNKEDCIRVEGMKLFRVRIKLVPSAEPTDMPTEQGKATLFLKSDHEITLRPNSKLVLNQQEITTKFTSTENTSIEYEPPLKTESPSAPCRLQHISSPSEMRRTSLVSPSTLRERSKSQKSYLLPISRKTSSIKKYQPQDTRTSTSSNFVDDDRCVNASGALSDKSLQQTELTEHQLPEPIHESVKDTHQPKQYITSEKLESQTSHVDKTCDFKFQTSEDILKILRKYVPESELLQYYELCDSSTSQLKPEANSFAEFYKQHICQDCGGVCQDTISELDAGKKHALQTTYDQYLSDKKDQITEFATNKVLPYDCQPLNSHKVISNCKQVVKQDVSTSQPPPESTVNCSKIPTDLTYRYESSVTCSNLPKFPTLSSSSDDKTKDSKAVSTPGVNGIKNEFNDDITSSDDLTTVDGPSSFKTMCTSTETPSSIEKVESSKTVGSTEINSSIPTSEPVEETIPPIQEPKLAPELVSDSHVITPTDAAPQPVSIEPLIEVTDTNAPTSEIVESVELTSNKEDKTPSSEKPVSSPPEKNLSPVKPASNEAETIVPAALDPIAIDETSPGSVLPHEVNVIAPSILNAIPEIPVSTHEPVPIVEVHITSTESQPISSESTKPESTSEPVANSDPLASGNTDPTSIESPALSTPKEPADVVPETGSEPRDLLINEEAITTGSEVTIHSDMSISLPTDTTIENTTSIIDDNASAENLSSVEPITTAPSSGEYI
ncbi:Epidermal growth factor receptor kinase substrate 8-like protein 1 [Thelohanellus kitauei]|uniref:Epidermal growth factor receptor kinase substrate 8-like protein 1 n=1 Tax=Thelohanellus kitauei TaxID=669202 RepID=A0A0C2N2E8_THEKT|nr:Epidermal growth factor receptor kinase substrate 8-like protein 1 [Thelohanellus kitauei]